MDSIKNARTFRNNRIYFNMAYITNRYSENFYISLWSGPFPHNIYCWLNVHPTFIKIIGPMIFFLEQKQSYIPMKNKIVIRWRVVKKESLYWEEVQLIFRVHNESVKFCPSDTRKPIKFVYEIWTLNFVQTNSANERKSQCFLLHRKHASPSRGCWQQT